MVLHGIIMSKLFKYLLCVLSIPSHLLQFHDLGVLLFLCYKWGHEDIGQLSNLPKTELGFETRKIGPHALNHCSMLECH